MKDFYNNKKILVTGGTGSIGSEIVRQLLNFNPAVIRIYSRDETKQYYLQQELGSHTNLRYLIGDVRDERRLKRAMEGIDYVFHAAALKHVPSCEYNPFEAVQTNVIGTQNLIQAALDAGVQRVIAISTDKAIDPINTMGATKLLAEKLMASANLWIKDTILACVRFGNVLGSRGSLVPLIEKQVARGGPVTITDNGMTRFMMSTAEAVQLVLASAMTANGGEIFILKMPALRIIDLIDVLVEHFALRYNRKPGDITINITGKRPGEKLNEALLSESELFRTEEREKTFVIHPPLEKAKYSFTPITPDKYLSDKAALLSKDEIRNLVNNALR